MIAKAYLPTEISNSTNIKILNKTLKKTLFNEGPVHKNKCTEIELVRNYWQWEWDRWWNKRMWNTNDTFWVLLYGQWRSSRSDKMITCRCTSNTRYCRCEGLEHGMEAPDLHAAIKGPVLQRTRTKSRTWWITSGESCGWSLIAAN